MREKNKGCVSRRPNCVTEIRKENTLLVVYGFYKQDTTETAADKMMRVLEAEFSAGLLDI